MDREKIRTVLNVLFLIGAVLCMILYFTMDDKKPFFYVCCVALFLKVMEFVLRIMR